MFAKGKVDHAPQEILYRPWVSP